LLSCSKAATLIENWHVPFRGEDTMGDKSPKSKQRQQKQKSAVKQQNAADAKAKQSSNVVVKDKK
jgi:hypothetical protein